ncbi:MAG TPA: hypothetical protein VMS17_09060 [Gemmataceae bacterium]|nr:hypothetical protein [Gemmataceae bacterium]
MAERIILEGREVCVTGGDGADARFELARFVQAVQGVAVQGLDGEALADNLKWKVTSCDLTVCVAELKPQLRRVLWIAPDSPAAFGPTATYRERRLAFPYVVLKAPFLKGKFVGRAELFYRNEPLRSLSDALCWPNLLNVSPNSYGCLAWLCTQYLGHERPAAGVTAGLDALVHHLFGGGFNRSSEVHEKNSAFSKAKADGVDARVTDVDRWEAESVRDPRFVLGVKWKPVGVTVGQLLEAELTKTGAARPLGATAELASLLVAVNGKKGAT